MKNILFFLVLLGHLVQAQNLQSFLSVATFNTDQTPFLETYLAINANSLILINDNNKIIIVIDRNVEYLLKNIKFKKNIFIIKIKGSEKIKNFNNYEILTKKILSFGVDRNSIVIAIGGGTIGDLSGFIASTILRGVKFVLMPTTLLSQVDSSIGGKNGINTNLGKNLIGTFYQPDEVFIDPKILESLPKKELQSGYAEVVKHALINDIFFFNWLDKNYKRIFEFEHNALVYTIHKSIKIKAKFIETDSKEILINNKSRALLNFGHTFGHALETLYGYNNKITHGEAISIGMIIASKLSNKLSTLKTSELIKITDHLCKVGLPIYDNKINNKKILSIIQKDKKNNDGKINLVLLKKIGKAYYSRNVNKKYIIKISN